jgi:hypothetical protein
MRWTIALVVAPAIAFAQPTEAQVHIVRVAAGAALDIRDCGKHIVVTYDFRAFAAIDWTGRDPHDTLLADSSSVANLGSGVNRLCHDPDYRAALRAIDTIVYRPSDDRRVRLVASVAGHTLTFTSYSFGDTRMAEDFEAAARRGLVASEPAVVTTTTPPVTPGPPSRAWDGTYPYWSNPGVGGMCFRGDLAGALHVSGGAFSFSWIADDWTTGSFDKQIVAGRVDGVVHADGTTTTVVKFTHPSLRSRKIAMVKLARELDAIQTLPMTFVADGDSRTVTAAIDAPFGHCESKWKKLPARAKTAETDKPRPRTNEPPPKTRTNESPRPPPPPPPPAAPPPEKPDPCAGLPTYHQDKDKTYPKGTILRASEYYDSKSAVFECTRMAYGDTCGGTWREPSQGEGWTQREECKYPDSHY